MPSWTAAFAEAVLPEYPDLTSGDRLAVQGRVAAFLERQLALAPWHLRFAVGLIGAAFRAAGRLCRPGGGFAGLDPEGRRRLIARWERLSGPTRSFVRLYRSLALLAFFEDPIVLRALGCPERESWRDIKRLERAMRAEVP